MRILFLQDSGYYNWAGGMKINRSLALKLAEKGHECRSVTAALTLPDPRLYHYTQAERDSVVGGVHRIWDGGTLVDVCTSLQKYEELAVHGIADFSPDVIVFSDTRTLRRLDLLPSNMLQKCVVAIHTPTTLPFGPVAILPDKNEGEFLKRVGTVLAVSQYLRRYLSEYGGVEAAVLPFPGYGEGPFPAFGRFDKGLVTLVNASPIKGQPILLQLAREYPDLEFGAVISWATRGTDLSEIRAVPNIRLFEPTPDIDEIFSQTRVLLAPSLVEEGFPVVAVEAMLRRIPVIASDLGGLPEATLGVGSLQPVRPIREWKFSVNPVGLSIRPVVPEQDIACWSQALGRLLADRKEYNEAADASRSAALEFVSEIRIDRFEALFRKVAGANERSIN